MGSSRQAKSRKATADQNVLENLKTRKLTMEQPSDPSAPHQVIYIVQAAKEKVNIKDTYNVKAATVLGIIHIIFGLISLGIEITNLVVDNLSVATGIWTSVLFFISGGLAIGGARNGNKCPVVATLVMAIISAVSAGILLILSTILLVSSYRYSVMTSLPSPLPLSLANLSAVDRATKAPSTTTPTLSTRLRRSTSQLFKIPRPTLQLQSR